MRVLPQVGDALTAWYSAHPQFVWVDDGKVSAKALAAMAALNASDKVGLAPADYRVDIPNLDGLDGAGRQSALLRFELSLSAKALTYVLDATRGRIDPDRLSGYHDLPRKTVDLGKAMDAMAQQADVAAWLDAPQSRQSAIPRAGRRARAAAGGVEASRRRSSAPTSASCPATSTCISATCSPRSARRRRR